MSSKTEVLFKMHALSGTLRFAVFAGCLFGLWNLAACSGTVSGSTETADASALPSGGMIIPTPEIPPPGEQPVPTPTVDALGVYPPPESASADDTAVPKAVPHSSGTNAVFLPAIINEKPPQYPFGVQQTGVLAIQGFFGCNWSGVAGQIFDQAGTPIQNLILHLEGIWDGKAVSTERLSGNAPQYGPAGYEFILGSLTLDSTQALWIQVLDAAHKQISPRVYFNTYNDCGRNLILVNFVQVR